MLYKETILVMEVIHKPTGEKRWIKASRFNPEFHIKPENCKFDGRERLVNVVPRSQVIDLSGLGQKKELKEDPKVDEVVHTTASADVAAGLPEKDILDDEKVDEVVNVTDDIESLPMFKIRQLAKSKGVKSTPTTKKVELIALIRAAE